MPERHYGVFLRTSDPEQRPTIWALMPPWVETTKCDHIQCVAARVLASQPPIGERWEHDQEIIVVPIEESARVVIQVVEEGWQHG